MSKSIVTANFNAVSTVILNANCSTFSESFGSSDNKVSLWNQGGIVKSGRGAPIIRDNKKVVGVYIAGEEQNCVEGPSYFARLQNSPNIFAYLRDEDETNAATVSMNYCKPNENLGGSKTTSETYQVTGQILSTQQINNGISVRYKAGTFIELNPGFVSGNDFIAEINPCVSNVTIIAAKTNDEYSEQQSEVETIHSEFSNNWIKLYPTILTSGSQLTIEANDDIDGVELQMFDMQGKHVRSFRLNSLLSGNTSSVPLDVPSGIYVIKAIRDFKLFTQKIIVQ